MRLLPGLGNADRTVSAGCTESPTRQATGFAPAGPSSPTLSREGLDPSLRAPQDQGVDVVGALVGVDRLEIQDVADHVVLVRDAVAAVHVAGGARDLQRLAAAVALDQRDHLRRRAALVHEPADPQAGLQAERDLGLHVGELLLDQLVGGQRPAELLALERVVPRGMPAELGRPQSTPGDAVARPIEAAERAL